MSHVKKLAILFIEEIRATKNFSTPRFQEEALQKIADKIHESDQEIISAVRDARKFFIAQSRSRWWSPKNPPFLAKTRLFLQLANEAQENLIHGLARASFAEIFREKKYIFQSEKIHQAFVLFHNKAQGKASVKELLDAAIDYKNEVEKNYWKFWLYDRKAYHEVCQFITRAKSFYVAPIDELEEDLESVPQILDEISSKTTEDQNPLAPIDQKIAQTEKELDEYTDQITAIIPSELSRAWAYQVRSIADGSRQGNDFSFFELHKNEIAKLIVDDQLTISRYQGKAAELHQAKMAKENKLVEIEKARSQKAHADTRNHILALLASSRSSPQEPNTIVKKPIAKNVAPPVNTIDLYAAFDENHKKEFKLDKKRKRLEKKILYLAKEIYPNSHVWQAINNHIEKVKRRESEITNLAVFDYFASTLATFPPNKEIPHALLMRNIEKYKTTIHSANYLAYLKEREELSRPALPQCKIAPPPKPEKPIQKIFRAHPVSLDSIWDKMHALFHKKPNMESSWRQQALAKFDEHHAAMATHDKNREQLEKDISELLKNVCYSTRFAGTFSWHITRAASFERAVNDIGFFERLADEIAVSQQDSRDKQLKKNLLHIKLKAYKNIVTDQAFLTYQTKRNHLAFASTAQQKQYVEDSESKKYEFRP